MKRHEEKVILSEYHFKKQVSYFLKINELCQQLDIETYSLTSLHSGASEADMSVCG